MNTKSFVLTITNYWAQTGAQNPLSCYNNHTNPEHGPEDDGVGGVLEPPGPGRHPEVQEAEAGDHPVTGEILKIQQMPLRVVQGDPVN